MTASQTEHHTQNNAVLVGLAGVLVGSKRGTFCKLMSQRLHETADKLKPVLLHMHNKQKFLETSPQPALIQDENDEQQVPDLIDVSDALLLLERETEADTRSEASDTTLDSEDFFLTEGEEDDEENDQINQDKVIERAAEKNRQLEQPATEEENNNGIEKERNDAANDSNVLGAPAQHHSFSFKILLKPIHGCLGVH